MAVSTVTLPTLLELSKRVDPGWKEISPIVELLSMQHGLMGVAPFQEGNLATGERTTVRTGLATPAWRMFNIGVTPSSTQTAQVDFQAAMLKSISECDTELLKIAPNKEQYLLTEATGHIEGMAQEWSSTAYYGTAASPEEFVGLASMYSSVSASNGQNVLDAGGTDASDNTSMWLVDFGPDVFGMYPRGSTAGISRAGAGVVWAENFGATGKRALVHREEYSLGGGFVVRDWRKIVRVASIDVSALVAQSSDANLLYFGTKAKHRIRSNKTVGRRVWLMNPTCAEYLEHQLNDRITAGGGVTMKNVDGFDVMHFVGFPVVIDDNILNTEAPV